MAMHVKVAGTWRKTHVQTKVSGAWKSVPQVYVKVNGTWKAVWSYAWNTGAWGKCSTTCGGGTQTRSVVCRRNDGVNVADAICTKFKGAKPAVSQKCNTQSCVTCLYEEGSVWHTMQAQSSRFDVLIHYKGEWVGTCSNCVTYGNYYRGEMKDSYYADDGYNAWYCIDYETCYKG